MIPWVQFTLSCWYKNWQDIYGSKAVNNINQSESVNPTFCNRWNIIESLLIGFTVESKIESLLARAGNSVVIGSGDEGTEFPGVIIVGGVWEAGFPYFSTFPKLSCIAAGDVGGNLKWILSLSYKITKYSNMQTTTISNSHTINQLFIRQRQ